MGLFDIPAPLLSWVDVRAAAVMPEMFRLVMWGAIGALVSMILYKVLSAQERIAKDKLEIREARIRLDAFDGEFSDAWPLISNLLRLSFRHVGRVGWPAIVASLPLLTLLGFLSTFYSYGYPSAGVSPEIQIRPASFNAEWINKDEAAPRIVIADGGKRIISDMALKAPVPVIHKRQWWNALIGNPAGYLPDNSAIDRITVSLPPKEYIPFGPAWMRGWEMPFFLSLLVISLIIKFVARIE